MTDVKKIPVARWPLDLQVPSNYVVPHVTPPVHQGECGACWAIAAASCFCDRARIPLTDAGYKDVTLNSEHCIKYGRQTACNSRCEGGFLVSGLVYVRDVGYLAHPGQRVRCGLVYRVNLFDTFGIVAKTYVDAPCLTRAQLEESSANIARDIYMLGSVCATFNMFSDFLHFWNTEGEDAVYELSSGSGQGSKSWTVARPGPGGNVFVVSHCVVIIGFGTVGTTDYWTCRSSWGTPLNRPRGLFRIRRGVNMCGIESDVMACRLLPQTDTKAERAPYPFSAYRPQLAFANDNENAWSQVTLVPVQQTSVFPVGARDALLLGSLALLVYFLRRS